MLRVAESAKDTDVGRQRRVNEDSLLVRPPLFVVADGMGGHQAGEVASGLAVETFAGGLPDGGDAAEFRLAELIQAANRQIHDTSRSDAEHAGMGTTITAAYVDVDDVAIAHVGDSRAYRWRDGDLERLTDDHSLVEELIRQGKLTAEEAEDHPQRSIVTRALGPEPDVQVDTRTVPARDGDLFLLCSDGLTGMIGEAGLARVLSGGGTLAQLVRGLIDAANAAGGRDNITVVLFRVEEVGELGGGGAAGAMAPTDQLTTISRDAVSTDRVRAAVADADAARVQPREARPYEPPIRRPGDPKPPISARRRRWRRRSIVAFLLTAVVVTIGLGLYAAINSVYFIGTDDGGRVTLFRGVPYGLPLGVDLYAPEYKTGIPAASLATQRRDTLLDHKLRSQSDAADLINQLELGQLQGTSAAS
jgi:serine/threonine protein phosphatase PrpC